MKIQRLTTKFLFYFGAVFVVLLSAFCAIFFIRDTTIPQVKLSPSVIDAGMVLEGAQLEFHSQLINSSNGTLVLDKIVKSCGCTDIVLQKHKIGPHETSDITINVTPPRKANGFETSAEFVWQKDASTHDPISLIVRGGISHPLVVTPEYQNFGDIASGSPKKTKVFHVQHGNSSIAWDSLQASANRMGVEVKNDINGGNSIEVTLDPSSGLVGQIGEQIHIQPFYHGQAVDYSTDVNASAHVTSDLEVKPSLLFLGSPRAGNSASGHFTLLRKTEEAKLIRVESTNPSVKAEIEHAENNKLTFRYNFAGEKAGDVSGKLFIVLATPLPRTIEVPFVGVVQPAK